MTIRLLLVPDETKTYDITPIAGEVKLISDTSALGQELSFSIANRGDMPQFFPVNPVDIGHRVVLVDDKTELFRGTVFTEDRNGREAISYTIYDDAVYLNQSTAVYQFNGTSATEAIRRVCTDFGMPVGSIMTLSPAIKKIYVEQSPASIIMDIIDQCEKQLGFRIRMEMRGGKLYIEKRSDLIVSGTFELAGNAGISDIVDELSNINRNRSIMDMRNSIKIISTKDGETYKVSGEATDANSIARYGLLQHVEQIEQEDVAKARQIARNRLSELNRVFETSTLQMFGNWGVRAGRMIDLTERITGLAGRYLIERVEHSVDSTAHLMTVNLSNNLK